MLSFCWKFWYQTWPRSFINWIFFFNEDNADGKRKPPADPLVTWLLWSFLELFEQEKQSQFNCFMSLKMVGEQLRGYFQWSKGGKFGSASRDRVIITVKSALEWVTGTIGHVSTKKGMRLTWAELKWRKAKQIRVALGNLDVDEFKNKPCCPIEERQLNQGVYKSFYLSFIIFASYIFKNSVEAIFKIDFAHARNGCPEVLAMMCPQYCCMLEI